MNTLTQIAAYLERNDDYILIAHVSPDGDTLGSSLALLCALRRMGKRVQLVCQNTVPAVYTFLPCADALTQPEGAKRAYCAVAVDCAAPDRLGSARRFFEEAEHTVNIDHHITNKGYAEYNHVEDCAATGEIVYTLLTLLEQMDERIATCLYTALVTDTGNFSYSNVTAETYRIAAALWEAGADNEAVTRLVYRTTPFAKTRLIGRAIDNIKLYCNGRLGIATLSLKDFADVGASSEDAEGVIDHVRDIDTVELAMLVRESREPNTGKVSLRSKRCVDVSRISGRMGGGGHMHAAGYTDHGTLAEIGARALSAGVAALSEENAGDA